VGTENKCPHTKGAAVYIRSIKSRKYGDYFQLVESYRDENGMVKKRVLVHLGEYQSPEAALAAWPEEIEDHKHNDRTEQAKKLHEKLERLRELTRKEQG
jgi:hypothetical protein